MQVRSVEHVDASSLLTALRETRLRGFDGARPYASSSLAVQAMAPDDVVPAQNYVLEPGIRTVLGLRAALRAWGVDVLALDGAVLVHTDDETIPVLPPIVEESHEPDGRTVLLVNDGMHRVFAARRLGLPVSCVVIRDVAPAYPYYAYALSGWDDVTALEELPDGHQKKDYRQPSSYKDLFREFNALFPGVQAPRRRTNPAHLHQ